MGVLRANAYISTVSRRTEPQMQPQSTTKQTILLVEDDADTRRVYSLILRHSGFVVVEAANGAEAVERALADLPDLILMDMNLPMFDGWEAARRIKSDPRTTAAPLIAFSAMIDSIADLRRGNALFDGFIAKPVTPSGLVRRVAAYLDLLAGPRPPKRTVSRRPSGSVAASAQAI
jgi:two-component system, cell cycle response regulator DivK